MGFFSQLLVLKVSTATTLSCAILSDPETPIDWLNLLFTAVLGGVRFFSLALFGKPTLTVGLVCGSLITLGSAGIYTYFKISKILEKDEGCVKKNEDFKKC